MRKRCPRMRWKWNPSGMRRPVRPARRRDCSWKTHATSNRLNRGEEAPKRQAGRRCSVRDFKVLLEISREINAVQGFEELREKLMDLTFVALPAESAAILLDPIGGGDDPCFSSVLIRHKNPKRRREFQVSRTVIERVLSTGQAVLSNDVPHDEHLLGAESLKLGRVQSLLCAPFRHQDDVRGVVYLDTTDPASPFDEDDLELLTGVSGIASAPLENARVREWLQDAWFRS